MAKQIGTSSHVPRAPFVQYKAPGSDERFVQLFSWWHSKDGKRKFAVVDNVQKAGRTIGIKLLEVDDSNPFYRDIAEFWDLVDQKKLVEYRHHVLGTETAID